MDETLKRQPCPILHTPTIVVTDSNLHSSTWNPDSYHKHDAAADKLVKCMTKWDLYLRSPKGVITYEAKEGMQSGTTIDLVWVNQQAKDLLIACLVESTNIFNHDSDHQALVTVVNIKHDDMTSPENHLTPRKNWHKANQTTFQTKLKALLPLLTQPLKQGDIITLDFQLIEAVTTAQTNPHQQKAEHIFINAGGIPRPWIH